MKDSYGLLVDLDRCIGCYACEIACKQENNLPTGIRWVRVIPIGPKKINGKLYMDFVLSISDNCTFCRSRVKNGLEPFCVSVCPTNALKCYDTTGMLKALRSGKRYQLCRILKPDLNR